MKKLYIFLVIILFSVVGYSQVTLAVDTVSVVNIPDTADYGATIQNSFVVSIGGSVPYTGTVYLVSEVDSSAGFLSYDTISQRSVVNKMNDTINFSYSETYNNVNGYRKGGNVVVIWPVASNATTVDTFQTNVFVRNTVGINEHSNTYRAFAVYPNPTQNYIYVENYLQNITFNRVRLFDVNSRLIYDEKFRSKIDIQALSKGIYLLNLELEDGEMLYYKVIKE